jgi:UDP-glucuronate 4-epimerase
MHNNLDDLKNINNSKILVTGCAGFIGFNATKQLLESGHTVIGVDNLNHYYDINLKQLRLNILKKFTKFIFVQQDLHDQQKTINLATKHPDIGFIIHLAAQAGVRYSLVNPFAYTESNITGHLAILELARQLKNLKHLVYASSSSVYGSNIKLPFAIEDRVDTPISLYAATKKSCELMSHCYSHLFGIRTTGLRFFTVYGPWGRPDMSAFIFTKAILNNQPIPVFNHGQMRRNFTYIDDIVVGTINCLFSEFNSEANQSNQPGQLFKLYNLGNSRSENLMDFIYELERQIGIKAKIDFQPMQLGDVKETVADITNSKRDFGFEPKTNIQEGLKNFVAWYKEHYHAIANNYVD